MSETPRADVVKQLLRRADRADLPRVRALIAAEIAAHVVEFERTDDAPDDPEADGCGDALYGLCFLLFLIGEAADVALVHRAKYLNMDTGFMIDRDLLRMRRSRDEMMATVAAMASSKLARDVAAAFDQPAANDAGVESSLRTYFALAD